MSKKKLSLIIAATAVCSSFLTAGLFYALLGMAGPNAKDMLRFLGALRFIETQYVQDVDFTRLIDGAIEGMVKTLDDPHSVYLDPDMYALLKEHTEGSFGGIGVVMGFKDSKVTVMSVLEGTPGEAAGIRTGDEIRAVDGTSVAEIQSEEVAMRIRGEAGTNVVLTIHREGEADFDVTITRAIIQVRTVRGEMLQGESGIGYIRIASFSEHTAAEFKESYEKLESEQMRGLIIDLRENPGGLVTSCVDIANMVVPEGLVVSVVSKDGSKEEFHSELKETKYPIVVLIDGNSASASEILAGALQDRGAATIVGTRSYGKGSVQVVMPLYEEDALKLTIAKYYTPSGRSIDGTGIEPDVAVDRNPDDVQDMQLIRAIDIMREKLGS